MIDIFKALGDETRLRILSLVIKREACLCEIEKVLNLTQFNTSRHLSCLKRAGIIESRKSAQWVYFTISENFIKKHGLLYNYLIENIKETKCYNKDCIKYEECKNLCLCEECIGGGCSNGKK